MYINTNKPYKIYADYVEPSALQQFQDAMNQDFVLQGVLLPDTHTGYTLPIGCAVLTQNCIVPAYVGYDIGCSVLAAKLNIKYPDIENHLQTIKIELLKKIPLGNNKHHTNIPNTPDWLFKSFTKIGQDLQGTRSQGQLGTLGSGNHFYEIGKDEEDCVWIIIHSGSRGLGHGIASHYMKIAATNAGKTTGNNEGHYPLFKGTKDYNNYLKDCEAAQKWAQLNREVMCDFGVEIISDIIEKHVTIVQMINHNHNHAKVLDEGVVIHRKGAVQAEKGQYGVIPMNMLDGSYIVKGKGNQESLCSSSHGAGRKMSRSKAKALLNFEDFSEMMSDIVSNISNNTLDENPLAYKNPTEVMAQQEDLIEVVAKVKPLINIKG